MLSSFGRKCRCGYCPGHPRVVVFTHMHTHAQRHPCTKHEHTYTLHHAGIRKLVP